MGLVGMPGIGGSLGLCAVCGGSFIKELLMSEKIQTFSMSAFDDEMCAHVKCVVILKAAIDDGWESLPDGPIRKAFEDAGSPEQNDNDQTHIDEMIDAKRDGD